MARYIDLKKKLNQADENVRDCTPWRLGCFYHASASSGGYYIAVITMKRFDWFQLYLKEMQFEDAYWKAWEGLGYYSRVRNSAGCSSRLTWWSISNTYEGTSSLKGLASILGAVSVMLLICLVFMASNVMRVLLMLV